MRQFRFTPANPILGLCCLAVFPLAIRTVSAQEYDPDWTRSFRVGAMVGFNIKAHFNTSGNFNVAPHPSGTYDDGYVRVDQTGDAQHYTSYWGYQNASQYDAASHTLSMHETTSFSTSGSATSKDEPYIGFDMAYGGILWRRNQLRIGWELGFGMMPIKISDNSVLAASATRNTYSFDTGNIVMPTAPYNGGSSGLGPNIHDTRTLEGSDQVTASITGSRTLDVTLYSLKLGPTFYWDATPYIGVQLGAGPALGITSGDLKFDETLTFAGGGTAVNRGQTSGTDLTWGGYVNAIVSFHTVRNGDFYVGAQYMPMGNAHIGSGGRSAELDLRGQVYIMAGINWPF